MAKEMQAHPIAALFPMLSGAAYEELRESIRESGLREPIITFEGKILDGRNRYRACIELGIKPEFVEWVGGGSPWVFVWDENAVRRHLEEGTKAAIKLLFLRGDAEWQAAKEKRREKANGARAEAGARQGHHGSDGGRGKKKTPGGPEGPRGVSGDARADGTPKDRERDDLAKAAGVSPTTAKRVLALESKAPDLFKQVASAEKSATKAYGEYRKREKVAVVEKVAAVPSGRFHVIVVDPPWQYEKHGTDDTYRSQNPYPDMPLEQIESLPVRSLAQDDCILWLWTTNTFLWDAKMCIDAWGFKPKTVLTWVKDRIGTGAWLRSQTEHCIVAISGKPVVTLSGQSTVLHGQMRQHSRKPDEFYTLVESLCPGSKLEMFARQKRPGWETWGAEAEFFDRVMEAS